jgi:hypothetical protein
MFMRERYFGSMTLQAKPDAGNESATEDDDSDAGGMTDDEGDANQYQTTNRDTCADITDSAMHKKAIRIQKRTTSRL